MISEEETRECRRFLDEILVPAVETKVLPFIERLKKDGLESVVNFFQNFARLMRLELCLFWDVPSFDKVPRHMRLAWCIYTAAYVNIAFWEDVPYVVVLIGFEETNEQRFGCMERGKAYKIMGRLLPDEIPTCGLTVPQPEYYEKSSSDFRVYKPENFFPKEKVSD